MKIIRQAFLSATPVTLRFNCHRCGCVFEESSDKCRRTIDHDYDGSKHAYTHTCPNPSSTCTGVEVCWGVEVQQRNGDQGGPR
jgi:hypothetical protein